MILHALMLSMNIVVTPFMIHTLGLGIVGAALASNLSYFIGGSIGFFIIWRRAGATSADVRFDQYFPRILRVGTPIALGTISYALVYWGMLYTSISPLGPHVNAALGIGFSVLEGFTWPCFHGVEMAVASFVGRSLGAGRPDQARRAIRLALPLSLFLGIASSLAFYFGADFLTGLFTQDPMVHEQAILTLRFWRSRRSSWPLRSSMRAFSLAPAQRGLCFFHHPSECCAGASGIFSCIYHGLRGGRDLVGDQFNNLCKGDCDHRGVRAWEVGRASHLVHRVHWLTITHKIPMVGYESRFDWLIMQCSERDRMCHHAENQFAKTGASYRFGFS